MNLLELRRYEGSVENDCSWRMVTGRGNAAIYIFDRVPCTQGQHLHTYKLAFTVAFRSMFACFAWSERQIWSRSREANRARHFHVASQRSLLPLIIRPPSTSFKLISSLSLFLFADRPKLHTAPWCVKLRSYRTSSRINLVARHRANDVVLEHFWCGATV